MRGGLSRLSTLVDTLDELFERVPGMKARRPRVAVDAPLRQRRPLGRVRKLLGQKREVGGDVHAAMTVPLEFSPECTGLERGE